METQHEYEEREATETTKLERWEWEHRFRSTPTPEPIRNVLLTSSVELTHEELDRLVKLSEECGETAWAYSKRIFAEAIQKQLEGGVDVEASKHST